MFCVCINYQNIGKIIYLKEGKWQDCWTIGLTEATVAYRPASDQPVNNTSEIMEWGELTVELWLLEKRQFSSICDS